MTAFDPEAFATRMGDVVKRYVEPVRAANAALEARNAELVTRLDKLERSIAGATMKGAVIDRRGILILTLGDGETRELGEVVGRDADPATIGELVAAAVEALPKAAPADLVPAMVPTIEDLRPMVGEIVEAELAARPPKDGKSADPEETRRLVEDLLGKAVAALPAPPAGKDADPEDIRRLVEDLLGKAVAALPAPQPGKNADPAETRALVAELVDAALQARPAPKDGEDADPEDIRALVEELVGKAVAALPKPQDGQDADPEDIRGLVEELVGKAVAALPAPPAGKDADAEQTRRLVEELVGKAVAALPKPRDGEDADPAMIAEAVAAALAELPKGREIAEAMIDVGGELVLTMTDGKMLRPGRVVGEDGFGVDDLEIRALDGGRTIEVRLKSGEREVVREVRTAALVDRGVWHPGTYHAGDGVTCKGSYWIAERDTDAKPAEGEADSGWRLAIKQGRPGRDAGRPGHGGRVASSGAST